MINTFVLRKYAALLLMVFVPTLTLMMMQLLYPFWISLFCFLGVAGVMLLISNKLLDNPFRGMVEGKGLLAFNMDSTGILKPFNVALRSEYVVGRYNKRWISTIFDRKSVFSLAPPVKAGVATELKDGGLKLEVDAEAFNKSRFALYHYPVLIWNEQVKSLLTKEFLSEAEKDIFAQHNIIYCNRKLEELTSATRDFGRHIVDNLKPKNWASSGWVMWIVIAAVVILAIMFLPKILASFGGIGGVVGGAAKTTGGIITPR